MRRGVANSFLAILKVTCVVALCISYFEFVDQTLSNSTSSILISPDHFYIVLYLLGNSKLRICSSIPMV